MNADEALRRLLSGTGARAVKVGPANWRIDAAPIRPARPRPPASALTRPTPVPAEPPPTPPTDIIVTASKREAPLSGYPGTVSRVDGAAIGADARDGTDAITTRLATLSSTHLGAGRNKLFIRGIADSSFTGPTQATVGQYLGDVRLSYNAPDPDLRPYDVAEVEVLEGPQGTLYGAGSLGGIVRIVRNEPRLSTVEGSVTAGLSATGHGNPGADLAGVVNVPLVDDTVGLRAVGYAIREGGYIDDPGRNRRDVNRTDIVGGRAAIRARLGGRWTVDVGATFQDTDGADSQYADRNGPRLTRSAQVDQGFGADYRLLDAVIRADLGDVRLSSSTGFARQELSERYDASPPGGPPRVFVQRNETRLISNETRLYRPTRNGLGWVVGASVLDNVTRIDRALGVPDAPLATTGVRNGVTEITGFGEVSVSPVEKLTLTLGARASRSWLRGNGENVSPLIARANAAVTARRAEGAFLPSAAVSAEPVEDLTLYARYQQGFRPGGLAIEGDFVRRFRSDRATALELGLRYGAPGRTPFDLNLSASHTRWRDIQADFIDVTGLPSTANIGDGRIWSFSASAGWKPSNGLRLEAGVAVNDGEVTEPDRILFTLLNLGRTSDIPNIAGVVARGAVSYERELDGGTILSVSASARYTGASRLGIGPVLGGKQGEYLDSRVTARLGFDGFGVSLAITNLADQVGNRFALGSPFQLGAPAQITPL
ncbi:MAG TPA: TonB-dependent receptor, partial [Sphingomonas sp.]